MGEAIYLLFLIDHDDARSHFLIHLLERRRREANESGRRTKLFL